MESSQTEVAASVAAKFSVWMLLVAAMLASIAGALIVGQVGNVFKMSPDFDNIPLTPSPEYMARYNAAISQYQSRNYAVHFAILGGLLGLAIGVLGAVRIRGQALAASMLGGAGAGVVSGLLIGTAAAYCVHVNRGEALDAWGIPIEPIVQTTALQCCAWALIGMGIGVGWTATVWGVKRIAKGLEGGLIGGLLAGATHCMVASLFFTNSSGFTLVPEKPVERLVWAALCGTCVAVGLVYSAALPLTAKRP